MDPTIKTRYDQIVTRNGNGVNNDLDQHGDWRAGERQYGFVDPAIPDSDGLVHGDRCDDRGYHLRDPR